MFFRLIYAFSFGDDVIVFQLDQKVNVDVGRVENFVVHNYYLACEWIWSSAHSCSSPPHTRVSCYLYNIIWFARVNTVRASANRSLVGLHTSLRTFGYLLLYVISIIDTTISAHGEEKWKHCRSVHTHI